MKAIILAAWYGSRMLPWTKTIPKEMLPVGTKPVIHYIVEALSMAGIDEIVIVVSQAKQALEDYFDTNYELEHVLEKKNKTDALNAVRTPQRLAKITFVRQFEQKGTGDAILTAAPWIGDQDAMIVYGDTIYHPRLIKWLVDTYKKEQKACMALKEIPREQVHKYGVVAIQDNLIKDIVEKPAREDAPSNLVTFSPYIVPPRFLELLQDAQADSQSGEVYPRDALKDIMHNEWVFAYVSDAPLRDTGNPEARFHANETVGKNPNLFYG